ncbi:N-acetylglucosaminyl-diphospho-decaprenol L-rhamnosyltransferase [Methanobrevibacter cuticularis]|uniref:N-acetylglucosaminyl-diphospho-decaprenol L-rhamnosyltransferase n=1 Tax=Methanobrevibacter cuticularis TaxID=47311 RepID=A0A166E062_9EURY|nr:glycosyltransferase family 2 protein [Methanobrevibacter cuticularis]KZX16134.1 N-acetylglucosaminyl-diphospho-decaprenol L-rhamnosyltransferase [Methanobrevibacter cuticularis]
MKLSVIIVNYKTYKLTKNTIISVLETVSMNNTEIILVDNNSNDGSLEKFRNFFSKEITDSKIKIIVSPENLGFAFANNSAIKSAKGTFILLLNSDTIVKNDTLANCVDYIENHDNVGALGCKILLPDGTLDKACKRSFPNPKNSFYKLFDLFNLNKNSRSNNYNLTNLDDDGIYEVDSLVGAFMLIRKETMDQIGLLDEDYFMYGEDIDYCYRIKEVGWKVIYYGKSEIIHYKGASSKKQKSKLLYEFYRAMYLFYNKHYKNEYSIITRIAVYLGIGVLFLVKLFLNIFKKQ